MFQSLTLQFWTLLRTQIFWHAYLLLLNLRLLVICHCPFWYANKCESTHIWTCDVKGMCCCYFTDYPARAWDWDTRTRWHKMTKGKGHLQLYLNNICAKWHIKILTCTINKTGSKMKILSDIINKSMHNNCMEVLHVPHFWHSLDLLLLFTLLRIVYCGSLRS